MTVRNLLCEGIQYLKNIPNITAQYETEILLENILHLDRIKLYTNLDQKISPLILSTFKEALNRRINREPLQYILGYTYFLEEKFFVNKNVVIPRPETETLVKAVLTKLKERGKKEIVFDLATGTGNIIISLAKRVTGYKFIGSDISLETLKVAKQNALYLGVDKKIKFVQADMFNSLDKILNKEKISYLLSNPPYIPTKDFALLQKEIKYEPKIGLNGGKDGLKFYRRIIKEASKYLTPNGYLFLEIPDKQKENIVDLINKNGKYRFLKVIKDYRDIERVIIINVKG